MNAKLYSIYALLHPTDLYMYYIGLTAKAPVTRFDGHISAVKGNTRPLSSTGTTGEILESGLVPIIVTVDQIKAGSKYALELERLWIGHSLWFGHPIENKRGAYRINRGTKYIAILHECVASNLPFEAYQDRCCQFAATLMNSRKETA